MKTITLCTVTVFAILSSSPGAERQVAQELRPSLAIFETVHTPMPDFHGVPFYEAYPDSQGRVVAGIGHSSFVRGWFRQMEPVAPKFAALDERLRLDVDVYGDTVREEGEKVLASTAGLKKALTDLDRATAGKVQDLLALYNDEVKATRMARAEFNVATKRAEEAGFLVESTDAGAKECNLLLERTKLEAEKAALLDRISKDAAFLNAVEKAIDTVAGGPQAMVAYAVGEARSAAKAVLVEVFHSGTRETLYEIGAKIEAIDKSLADVKCKQQGAALKAAKANLEARMIQTLVAFGKILDHRAKAWNAVDRLGTLKHPSTGRALPFFANLQAYNAQVNLMGRTVFDAVNAYLEFLGKAPVSRGPLVLAFVNEDIALVDRESEKRDPGRKWSNLAGQTQAYLSTYADWYAADVRRGQTVLADLREGRHLDFVDRMLARATKELGGTVSYEDVIR